MCVLRGRSGGCPVPQFPCVKPGSYPGKVGGLCRGSVGHRGDFLSAFGFKESAQSREV